MTHQQGILAFVLAAVIAVSPAIACADFCPDAAALEGRQEPASSDTTASMPADCADATSAPTRPQSQSHDPNCQGCSDCPATVSVKTPALAAAGALTVDAPTVIAGDLVTPSVSDFDRPLRHRMTPPAHGPPVIATPVILKDTLRL